MQEVAIVRRRVQYLELHQAILEEKRAPLRLRVDLLSRIERLTLFSIDTERKMDRKRLHRLRHVLAALEAGETNAATLPCIQGDNHGVSAAAWSNPEVRIWLYSGGVTSHAAYANA